MADGDVVHYSESSGHFVGEVITKPVGSGQAEVIMTNTDGAFTALTIGGTYDQAQVTALRDACETLADDVRNLTTLANALRSALIALKHIKGSA